MRVFLIACTSKGVDGPVHIALDIDSPIEHYDIETTLVGEARAYRLEGEIGYNLCEYTEIADKLVEFMNAVREGKEPQLPAPLGNADEGWHRYPGP